MRLLIVDDSELMRKVTRLAFRSTAELSEATNGIDALAVLATSH
jgi:CheY-like chemotaxis protein